MFQWIFFVQYLKKTQIENTKRILPIMYKCFENAHISKIVVWMTLRYLYKGLTGAATPWPTCLSLWQPPGCKANNYVSMVAVNKLSNMLQEALVCESALASGILLLCCATNWWRFTTKACRELLPFLVELCSFPPLLSDALLRLFFPLPVVFEVWIPIKINTLLS